MRGITPIIDQIADSIKLFTGRQGSKTWIPEQIIPVADIYKTGKIEVIDSTISVSGTGHRSIITVPASEYWTIHLAHGALESGTFTVQAFYISTEKKRNADTNESSDPNAWTYGQANALYPIYITGGGQTVLIWTTLNKDLRLPPNTVFGVLVDGYTGTGNFGCQMLISREVY